MTKTLRTLLIALFIFQILISLGFELAHDEAYYWLYSKNLAWGYFDHPPFVGVVIRLFSFLPHGEFSVRIGFILLQFAALLITMNLSTNLWISALLFFSFPLASFTGLLALPDIPLLFMTACYFYQLKRYLEKDDLKNSGLLGLVIAVLFYAKYHGVLLVFFTMLAVPKLLLRKSFYLVAVVALVAFMPHMLWEYQHDFSTLRYHFIERPKSSFSFKRSLDFLLLQVGLAGVFAGPLVWWILIKKKSVGNWERVLKFVSLGTVLFFLFSSFSKKVEANWTIYLAVPMIILVSGSELWKKSWAKSLLGASLVLVVLARILFVMPPEVLKLKRLNEFHGWENWAQEVKDRCEGKPLLANSYQIASKLSYYLETEINALNYRSRKNQFDVWRFDRSLPTKEVCYVTDVKDLQGEETVTPEGKVLFLVKKMTLAALWELKYGDAEAQSPELLR